MQTEHFRNYGKGIEVWIVNFENLQRIQALRHLQSEETPRNGVKTGNYQMIIILSHNGVPTKDRQKGNSSLISFRIKLSFLLDEKIV